MDITLTDGGIETRISVTPLRWNCFDERYGDTLAKAATD